MDTNIENVNFEMKVGNPVVFEIMEDELLSVSRATVQVYSKPKYIIKMNDETLHKV